MEMKGNEDFSRPQLAGADVGALGQEVLGLAEPHLVVRVYPRVWEEGKGDSGAQEAGGGPGSQCAKHND